MSNFIESLEKSNIKVAFCSKSDRRRTIASAAKIKNPLSGTFLDPHHGNDSFLRFSIKGVKGIIMVPFQHNLKWGSSLDREEGDDGIWCTDKCAGKHLKCIKEFMNGKRFKRYVHRSLSAINGTINF